MRAILEVLNGPEAGRCVLLHPGDVVRSGRAIDCEIPFLSDALLAPKQFALTGDRDSWTLIHLDGEPTIWNGEPVLAQQLSHLDQIVAGSTLLRFFDLSMPAPANCASPTDRLCVSLEAMEKPLFAVADLALEPWIRNAAEEEKTPAVPLLLGYTEEQTTQARPWLFSLTGAEPFLRQLVRGCWSRGRVAFLCADETLDGLAAALRPFLFLKDEKGEFIGFRFFDPRALRALLPVLNPVYVDAFFSAAPVVICEDSRPRFLKTYYGGSRGARSVRVPLVPDALYLPTQFDIRDRLRATSASLLAFTTAIVSEFNRATLVPPGAPEQLLRAASERGFQSVEAQVQYVVVKTLLGEKTPFDAMWSNSAGQADRDAAIDRFVDRWNLQEAL